ncbi:MAG: 30S ribosomal protein S16 [Candidatus Omnitrophica bacterium]|nr:30S ribosomal protein S16 [Candidatus Omnitrophota bacterium]
MAVRIRLRRIGKNPKKRPHFRITVFDERRNRDGRFIEDLGFYNPISKQVRVNLERYNYWLEKGAQPTAAVKLAVKKSVKVLQKEA